MEDRLNRMENELKALRAAAGFTNEECKVEELSGGQEEVECKVEELRDSESMHEQALEVKHEKNKRAG